MIQAVRHLKLTKENKLEWLMPKVAIYARSLDEKNIAYQVKECKEFAERNGYEVVEVYADTSTNENLISLIKQALKTNDFQYVLVHNPSRISRNPFDFHSHQSKLKKAGKDIISAKGGSL